MKTASFISRVFHQWGSEWRRHRGLVLLWLLSLVLWYWQRGTHDSATLFYRLAFHLGSWLKAGVLLLAAGLAWRCVSADAPSNTDTFSLTRPVGQPALWCGKVLFLISSAVIPAVMVLGTDWRGFGLGTAQWLALGGSVMLAAGLVCAASAALTAMASSSRQVIGLAVLAVVGAGVWLAMTDVYRARPPGDDVVTTLEEHHRELCGNLAAALWAFAGLIAAGWVAAVPRRRFLAAGLVTASLAFAPLIAQAWRIDWVTRPPLSYANSSKLGLKVGKADPADKTPGRGLWPTLRLTGLGKDEVASIVEFAPLEPDVSWPPQGSYSDLTVNENGYDSWLHYDHTRALFKHSPPATLWRQTVYNSALFNGRQSLDQVLQTLRLRREEAIQRPWRLRLVIHEMKRLAAVPYRQFWTQENRFLIRPGLRLECNPYAWTHDAWEMCGCVHRLSSAVLPIDAHRSTQARGRQLSDDFLLVLEDPELRENHAMSLCLVQRQGRYCAYRESSQLWQIDEDQGFALRMWTPQEQHLILKTTHEEWVNRLNTTLWHAEERGTVDLELTPEQMVQVLPEPKKREEKKKPATS